MPKYMPKHGLISAEILGGGCGRGSKFKPYCSRSYPTPTFLMPRPLNRLN